jgi:hypothetical protein
MLIRQFFCVAIIFISAVGPIIPHHLTLRGGHYRDVIHLGDQPNIGAESNNSFLVRNVRIFDGTRLLGANSVLVNNGRIDQIGVGLIAASDTAVLDGGGDTLLPGLIDSHVHTYVLPPLKQELMFGVTTELDMQDDPKFAVPIKQAEARGEYPDMTDIFTAGWAATAPGGHGAAGSNTISKPEDAQAFIDARIKEGSDYIKIIDEDATEIGARTPNLSLETIAALVQVAHQRGKLAVAHIGNYQGGLDTIKSGIDGLAHLFNDRPPGRNFGRFVAAHHAFVIPTLTVLESTTEVASGASLSRDPRLVPYLTQDAIRSLNGSFSLWNHYAPHPLKMDYAFQAEKQLLVSRVPVLAGTDAPNPGTWYGVSMHRELELLVKGGMTPSQALAAATSVPARVFHLNDRGRIAPGLRADFVLVKGDPTRDITNTRAIVGVWKSGVRLDRDATFKTLKAASIERAMRLIPAGSESGLVSNFEAGSTRAQFGSGWKVLTDVDWNGKSTAEMKVVQGGSQNSQYSLEVAGEVLPGSRFPWAGVEFTPGMNPWQPANLSARRSISFWAKGDGQTYQVRVITQSRQAIQNFVAAPDWKPYTMPLSSFRGTDGGDLTGVLFAAGPTTGKFQFQIDDVRFQ